MPKFHPTPIIQDCWSSIGNITFYHRNGQCFYKRKIKPVFPGTPAQLDQAQVHHRAILAWQQLPHAGNVVHRPGLVVHQHEAHQRRVLPDGLLPQPYPLFPISHLQLLQVDSAGSLGFVFLRCRLTLQNTDNPARWHVSARIQLTAPGVGCDPGKMRSCMATHLSDTVIAFTVPNLGLEDYKVHIRYRLIDEVTGYRNNWIKSP